MLMSILMFITWQVSNDPKYQEPFNKCVEATYANSDLKRYADAAVDRARDTAPAAAVVLPAAYSLGIRKQVNLTSHKVTLVPGTVTSYHYDERAKAGSFTVTFAF